MPFLADICPNCDTIQRITDIFDCIDCDMSICEGCFVAFGHCSKCLLKHTMPEAEKEFNMVYGLEEELE